MEADPSTRPSFQITHETTPSEKLVAGFSSFGLAGLTAVDFLTDQLDLEETGYISTEALPSITPFENGTPRHHTRLFSRSDLDITLLVNELFVPPWAADPFAKSVLEWTDTNTVQEITILSGIPLPHGPQEHQVFYVATEDYQSEQLASTDIPAMGAGFLDGVNASLVGRGMDTDLRVGVFVTPVHQRIPDVEAALRLLVAAERLYGLDIDTTALEQFAREIEQYYRGLEDRLQAMDQTDSYDDRMYM
ncbi:proteasome assembly chaperone family protein [Halomicrobium urmianum]|uniref:proteasome assembly chaperone family protein n=1 Tax=Halomicrobium urmianum TaxID=1586233 RepID=UPI001CD9736A|nr:PAC2 family protein [Halomicrobium urmianum]